MIGAHVIVSSNDAEADAGSHELFFMCTDLESEMSALITQGVDCAEVEQARWGSVTKLRLPGGGHVGLYQPRHPSPLIPTMS